MSNRKNSYKEVYEKWGRLRFLIKIALIEK